MELNEYKKRKIKRLELYHYSIEATYQHLKDVLYKSDENETFKALKSLLDLIFSTDEMYFNKEYRARKDSDGKGKYLNGLRYAANALKHEKICFKVH